MKRFFLQKIKILKFNSLVLYPERVKLNQYRIVSERTQTKTGSYGFVSSEVVIITRSDRIVSTMG